MGLQSAADTHTYTQSLLERKKSNKKKPVT